MKTEFTDTEKTLFEDIAMAFREKGIPAKFCLYPQSKTALAKFIDFETRQQYIHVSKHRESGVIEYQVSHNYKPAETYLNFSDVLIDCQNYIAAQNAMPLETKVLNLQAYKKA